MKTVFTASDYLRLQQACHTNPRDIPIPRDMNVRRHIGALREAIQALESMVTTLAERVEKLEASRYRHQKGE